MLQQRNQLQYIIFITILCAAVPLYDHSPAYGLEYKAFKKLCQDGIRQKTMTTVDVKITYGDDVITGNIGQVMSTFSEPHYWISVLRRTQVGIESVRMFSNERRRRRNFWAPHLQTADQIVATALTKVQDTNLNDEQKLAIADKANETATSVFASALRDHAKVAGQKYAEPKAAGPLILFDVKTKPSGLTVELLSVGDYIILRKLDPGANIENTPLWMALSATHKASTYGIFYYRFRKDGKVLPPAFAKDRVKDITVPQDIILFE